MLTCWKTYPEDGPTFESLSKTLGRLLGEENPDELYLDLHHISVEGTGDTEEDILSYTTEDNEHAMDEPAH